MIIVALINHVGVQFDLPEVPTLRKAREQVEELERRFEAWQAQSDPEPLDPKDPLAHYEGTTVIARGTVNDGRWFMDDDWDWVYAEELEQT